MVNFNLRLHLAAALLLLSAATHAANDVACALLREADIARAFAQPVKQVAVTAAATASNTSNCQWRLVRAPNAGVTLTLDRYATRADVERAWRAALDTYLHAGKMIRTLPRPAMWVPKKWGTTGLLYFRAPYRVGVISVPTSSARELRAAQALALLVLTRVGK